MRPPEVSPSIRHGVAAPQRRWKPPAQTRFGRLQCTFVRRSNPHPACVCHVLRDKGGQAGEFLPRQSCLAVPGQKASPGRHVRRIQLDLERGSISIGEFTGQCRVRRELVDPILDPQEPCRIAQGSSDVPTTGGVERRNWISWSQCNIAAVVVIHQLSLMTLAEASERFILRSSWTCDSIMNAPGTPRSPQEKRRRDSAEQDSNVKGLRGRWRPRRFPFNSRCTACHLSPGAMSDRPVKRSPSAYTWLADPPALPLDTPTVLSAPDHKCRAGPH
jgi:hypothetical protein